MGLDGSLPDTIRAAWKRLVAFLLPRLARETGHPCKGFMSVGNVGPHHTGRHLRDEPMDAADELFGHHSGSMKQVSTGKGLEAADKVGASGGGYT